MSENIVINPEDIKKRKVLRKNILLEFYEFYIKTGGEKKRMNPKISEDNEVAAAYHYLIERGLLYAENHKNVVLLVKISPIGIDFIESNAEF